MNKKQELFENTFSDNYKPSWFDAFVQRHETHRSKVMSGLIHRKKGVLLDLACGDGVFLQQHCDRYEKLVGFDIAFNRIANAKQNLGRCKNKSLLKVHDLDEKFPLKDKEIDVAVCEASIGCLVRPDTFLKEIHRTLKDDGEFIVQIGNYAYAPRRLALLFGKLPKVSAFPGWGDGGMLHYFTYESLAALLKESGFRVVEQSNSGFLARWRRWWPTLLAPDIIYRAVKDK